MRLRNTPRAAVRLLALAALVTGGCRTGAPVRKARPTAASWPPRCAPKACLAAARRLPADRADEAAVLLLSAVARAERRRSWILSLRAQQAIDRISWLALPRARSVQRLIAGACRRRDPVACYALARFYLARVRSAAAAPLLRRACSGAKPLHAACAHLADLHSRGSGGVTLDPGRARWLYRSACSAGHPLACAKICREAYDRRAPNAFALCGRACDTGLCQACDLMAKLVLTGRGGAVDPRALLGRARRGRAAREERPHLRGR